MTLHLIISKMGQITKEFKKYVESTYIMQREGRVIHPFSY